MPKKRNPLKKVAHSLMRMLLIPYAIYSFCTMILSALVDASSLPKWMKKFVLNSIGMTNFAFVWIIYNLGNLDDDDEQEYRRSFGEGG